MVTIAMVAKLRIAVAERLDIGVGNLGLEGPIGARRGIACADKTY